MFDIQTQLFEGKDVRFGPIDYEKDPAVESAWTHDSDFVRLYDIEPARPMSAAMVKKSYEKLEKSIEEDKNKYFFTIRLKEDDRLIGKVFMQGIEWTNGNCWVQLGIGAAEDRRKGYGAESLGMLLRFAFGELNLHRVSARVPEYNEAALALFKKFGFVEEVRRRQAMERDSRRWDMIVFGLLKAEWANQVKP
ncbi:MAG: GNAT family N-acetyltransferase [Anaerolineales bacterium]|nr:GNAT family N-acetyltransferase [Anaerolineales bacterium]